MADPDQNNGDKLSSGDKQGADEKQDNSGTAEGDHGDYKVIDSPLSCDMRRDGIDIEVQIYRGEDEEGWILDVVDSAGSSFIWEERFVTDQAALDELLRDIAANGMKQFNPHLQKRSDQ